jgi:hypothetical protein
MNESTDENREKCVSPKGVATILGFLFGKRVSQQTLGGRKR